MFSLSSQDILLIQEIVASSSVSPVLKEEIEKKVSEVEMILQGQFDFRDSFGKLEKGIFSLPRFTVHSPMFYRDYVGVHHERLSSLGPYVQYVVQYGIDILGIRGSSEYFSENGFDFTYFRELLSRHDEPEIFSPFGDIPSHIKYQLSPECKHLLDSVERCIEIYLSKNFQSVAYYNEEEKMKYLFEDARIKKTLEAQFMSYLDKVDGFMMAFHEICAGNRDFIVPLQNYIHIFERIISGEMLPLLTPFFSISLDKYASFLSSFHSQEREIFPWFLGAWCLFDVRSFILSKETIEKLLTVGSPHKKDVLYEASFGNPGYLSWKRAILGKKSPSSLHARTLQIGEKEMTIEQHLTTKVEESILD